MQLSITARHNEVSDQLKDYAEKKIYRIRKYFNHILDAQLVLDNEKHESVAELTVHCNGITLHAEERNQDFHSCIDLVVDKIERQLKRYHDRLKNHRTRSPEEAENRSFVYGVLSAEDVEQMVENPRIIRSKRFAIKPMSMDEAVLQMDLLNQEFLVFENSRTKQVNVIYRRKDGHYGLVEPAAAT
ncbi:ribosome-associated translation inhibitor RaiA [bacterium]|nr:ribosome-associated translation inhibitor RaiA [bacterium]